MKIDNKRIIITGASSGIGLELAKKLALKNCKLLLVSRNSQNLDKAAEGIRNQNPNTKDIYTFPCDITGNGAQEKILGYCQNLFGGLDILINNAGAGVYGAFEKMTIEDFRHIMEVNYFSIVNFTINAIQYMKQSSRCYIVNIASVAALHGVPYLSAYSASKAAVSAFSQSIKAELWDRNISVMVFYPGYTETNLFSSEKRVGGARRPSGKYMPSEKVAGLIIKCIQHNKNEAVFSTIGKLLKLLNGLFPKFADIAMRKIAVQLKTY